MRAAASRISAAGAPTQPSSQSGEHRVPGLDLDRWRCRCCTCQRCQGELPQGHRRPRKFRVSVIVGRRGAEESLGSRSPRLAQGRPRAVSRCPAAGCRGRPGAMSVWPQKAIVRSSSLWMISQRRASRRPRPSRPGRRGRRGRSACRARRARTAFSTSWPERMPPSIRPRSASPPRRRSPAARAIDDGAPSSWRPPWLETIDRVGAAVDGEPRVLDVQDALEDQLAAPALLDPLDVGPGQRAGRTARRSMPTATTCRRRPWRGRRCCRSCAACVPSMPRHQRGLVARLSRLRERRLGRRGQAVLQVLVALAEDLQVERQHQRRAVGGLGALDQALDEVAVAHHVELEPERLPWCARRRPRSSRCSWSRA